MLLEIVTDEQGEPEILAVPGLDGFRYPDTSYLRGPLSSRIDIGKTEVESGIGGDSAETDGILASPAE